MKRVGALLVALVFSLGGVLLAPPAASAASAASAGSDPGMTHNGADPGMTHN